MPELKMVKMSEVKPRPVKWLWEPYIPLGAVSLLQGDVGEGKTTASLAIAAAVSTGAALPNGNGGAPANVIIQNAEDPYDQKIEPSLELFGADCGRIEFIDEDECALSFTDGRIEQSIERVGAKLCILDPVIAYSGGANLNSAKAVRPLMKKLGKVAAKHECAILLVGHLHKSGGRAAYRTYGSVDIYAAARSVLTVGRMPNDAGKRAIVHNKSNLSPAGTSQTFGFDQSGRFMWTGESGITIDELLNDRKKPESQLAKSMRLIRTALANGPVLSSDMMQIAEDESISPKTFNRAKDELGVISRKQGEQWYWILPVEIGYEEVGQDGQDGQDETVANMKVLALLPSGTEG
jgi:hypothetical protein